MRALKRDIIAKQGDTLRRRWRFYDIEAKPIDFTGFTAAMQVRADIEDEDPTFDLTTENDGIVLHENGYVDLYISKDDMTTQTAPYKGTHDLEVVAPNGDRTTIVEGKFKIRREVTRA